MFWHIDTEAVCMIILCVLYIYIRKNSDMHVKTNVFFRRIVAITIVLMIIDIIASVTMDFSINWWWYQVINTIYFVTLPILAMLWFMYSFRNIYGEGKKLRLIELLCISPYIILCLAMLTNPWTGWIFGLTKAMEYSRGPLFWVVVRMQDVYCAVTITLVLCNFKKLSRNERIVLVLAPAIEIVAAYIHLANSANGYLLMNAGYTIAYIIVYLNMEHLRQLEQRVGKEKEGEFQRFIGYLYRSDYVVFELDFAHDKMIQYDMDETQQIVRTTLDCNWDVYLLRIVHSNEREATLQACSKKVLSQLEANGERIYFETCTLDEHGKYTWYSYNIIGLPKEDKRPNNVLVFRQNIDLTKREEQQKQEALQDALQEAKRANTAKSQFTSRMSHEMRTPLNAVIGYLSIAETANDDVPVLQDSLTKAKIAAKHLLGIINDVLDLSTIEFGKLTVNAEVFDMRKLLSSIGVIFEVQADTKNVSFNMTCDNLKHIQVVGDSIRLNQVLTNLLSNAFKFTPSGGKVTLRVTQAETADGKLQMQFYVQDTGIGMSEEFMKRMFNAYEQEKNVSKLYGGTGLGLSITQSLVNAMGGTITAESTVGQGSNFVLTLTFDKYDDSASRKVDFFATKGNVHNRFEGIRVLLVEDNAMNMEIATVLLKKSGFIVDQAVNGQEALDMFTSSKVGTYKAILMDVQMPVMDGHTATRAIRASLHNQAKTVPIIAMTADAFAENVVEALEAGMNAHIAKPIDVQKFYETLAQYVLT